MLWRTFKMGKIWTAFALQYSSSSICIQMSSGKGLLVIKLTNLASLGSHASGRFPAGAVGHQCGSSAGTMVISERCCCCVRRGEFSGLQNKTFQTQPCWTSAIGRSICLLWRLDRSQTAAQTCSQQLVTSSIVMLIVMFIVTSSPAGVLFRKAQ